MKDPRWRQNLQLHSVETSEIESYLPGLVSGSPGSLNGPVSAVALLYEWPGALLLAAPHQRLQRPPQALQPPKSGPEAVAPAVGGVHTKLHILEGPGWLGLEARN